MAEPFVGEIRMTGFNFAPVGWALCSGQIMPISQNQALFSLLGTTYGGDGLTTFALPDFRGRVPIHQGQGAGLSPYVLGEAYGVESATLSLYQMPSHSHQVNCGSVAASQSQAGVATQADPAGNFPGAESAGAGIYTGGSNAIMNPAMITPSGGSVPHENRQPSLVVNFIIALQGIFPSRT